AQIINIEKKKGKINEQGLNGNFSLSATILQNENEFIQVFNSIDFIFKKNKHSVFLYNNFGFGTIDKAEYIKEGYQHLRYNYLLIDSFLTVEAFVQQSYNTIKKIEKRYLAGFGPRFRMIQTNQVLVYFGPLFLYEIEKEVDAEIWTRIIRSSTYLSFNFSNKYFTFNQITYFQSDVGNVEDYRINNESSITFKLSQLLSFESSISIMYDNQPPENIRYLYYFLQSGIKFSF
ncbi:DUF481 domain-containing protein, partial [Bacteroidota bacterium]